MTKRLHSTAVTVVALSLFSSTSMVLLAQDLPQGLPDGPPFREEGRRFGPGGPGPEFNQTRKLVDQFDKDGDKRLNREERDAARASMEEEKEAGRDRRRGPRRPFGRGMQDPATPGPKIAVDDVTPIEGGTLYDLKTLRTFFFEFEDPDWEKELTDFNNTDVEIPAKLTVDGKVYEGVGVRVRGASSSMVPEGYQRPLNISIDFTHEDQRLGGYKTLNLHSSNGDPSMMRAVLYSLIARNYIPTPKANHVHVVINGESWGVYQNIQQTNKEFIEEWYGTRKGARWKTPGSPRGEASLDYLGHNLEDYKKLYEIKSKDKEDSWKRLIKLCKTLSETPQEELKQELPKVLDIAGALKFLALENVLVNSDGYWTRASDYNMYLDQDDLFHIYPHDINEAFSESHGPGGFGPRGFGPRRFGPPENGDFPPPRGGFPAPDGGFPSPPRHLPAPNGNDDTAGSQDRNFGPPRDFPNRPRGRQGSALKLDPLVAAKDESKLLANRLLSVPEWRELYLGYVHAIAEEWLDWNKLGPIAEELHALIAEDVKASGRKHASNEAFVSSLTGTEEKGDEEASDAPRMPSGMPLKAFADQRRDYLMSYQSTWED